MKREIIEEEISALIDLDTERIKKKVLEELDPDCREAAAVFLNKYKKDTLTGGF